MTAPDPTAGERPVHGRGDGWATACGQDRANVRLWTDDPGKVTCRACLPASSPAVAAPTGTSEDVETRCIVGLSDAERDDWAEVLMRRWGCEMDDESAYDNACRDVDALWHLVAAREAAARAEAWDECINAHHEYAVAQGLAFAHPPNPYRDAPIPPERGDR